MKREVKRFSSAFIAPAFLVYAVFIIVPVLLSVYYSFTKWDGISPKVFIGFRNYAYLFTDSDYWMVVKNTAVLILYSVIFQVFLGLVLAYLLYRCVKGFKFFRTVFFLPVVISPIAIGLMFSLFYNTELGPLNKFLEVVGLAWMKHEWLSDPKIVLNSVIFPQVWQYIGLYIVIFLAALQSVPEEILESARMDGASSFKTFVKIILPLLWEISQICIILAVTGSLKAFDHAWVITGGGPGNASSYIALSMFRTAFVDHDFGYGSTLTATIMLYAVLFTMAFKKFFSTESVEY